MTEFLTLTSISIVVVFVALFAGVIVVLKKRGFFSKARDDAAATLNDAAKEAVTKVLK